MFENVLTSSDQLADHYREPSDLVLSKTIDHLDDACIDFIARSTFVLVATSDGTKLDVSPRGGPAGFVKTVDEHRLVIPDLNGNNRLDSLRNVIDHGEVGLLFLVPGLGETLRVNGKAWVTVDDPMLDLFTAEVRRPASAIGVGVDEAFLHCAKAFRRGSIWNPEEWVDVESRPRVGQLLVDHAGLVGVTGEQIEAGLDAGYERELAMDLPE